MRKLIFFALAFFVPCLAFSGSLKLLPMVGVSTAVTGGEIGNKSGSNDSTTSPTTYPGRDQGLSGCFVCTQTGPISYIHVSLGYSSGTTGQQYNVTISSSDGNTLLRDGSLSDEGAAVPRVSIALDSSYTINSGTTYCLTFGSHNSPDSWSIYRTSSAGQNVYEDSTYTVGNTMPSTVDVTTVKTPNYSPRIWATNTADGS